MKILYTSFILINLSILYLTAGKTMEKDASNPSTVATESVYSQDLTHFPAGEGSILVYNDKDELLLECSAADWETNSSEEILFYSARAEMLFSLGASDVYIYSP